MEWKGSSLLRRKYGLFIWFSLGLICLVAGCQSQAKGPNELLERYFSSAVNQDYGTTYTCYYDAYKAKVTQEEYIKHRKEASVLQSYKIISTKLPSSDTAVAEVQLTFGPSEKLQRKEPVTVTLKEEMIMEKGQWRIKVW
jgi:hypothetical protein